VRDARDEATGTGAEAAPAALLEALLAGAPLGLAFLDPDGRVLRANALLASLDGIPVDQHGGRPLAELAPGLWEAVQPAFRAACQGRATLNQEHRAVAMRPERLRDLVAGTYPVHEGRAVVGVGLVVLDVTPMRQVEEALRSSDRSKDAFLATLGHELRNLLAPLRNAFEVVQLAQDDTLLVERSHRLIERQISHMTRLVDDLLDVSRIGSGKLSLRVERTDLAQVLARALDNSRPHAERAGHAVHLSLPSEPLWVDADPERLAQAFTNLFNNACKYTEPNGRIGVDVEREELHYVVSVADTGIGIPADVLPRVFDLFSQEEGRGRAHDGLGIGLTLVRSIVELHGGVVEAHSDGPGKGSTFRVRVPIPPDRAAAPPG